MADLSKKEEELLKKLLAKKLEKKPKVVLEKVVAHRLVKMLEEQRCAVVTLSSKGKLTVCSWAGYQTWIAKGTALAKETGKELKVEQLVS